MERRGFFAALAAAVVAPFAAKAVDAKPKYDRIEVKGEPLKFSHRPDEPCNCTWYTGESAGPTYQWHNMIDGNYRVTRCDGRSFVDDGSPAPDWYIADFQGGL